MVDLQNQQSMEQYSEIRLMWDLVWLELTFIRMKVCPEMNKLTFSCAMGYHGQFICSLGALGS